MEETPRSRSRSGGKRIRPLLTARVLQWSVVFLGFLAVVRNEVSSPLLYQTLRGNTHLFPSDEVYVARDLYVPHSLDAQSARRLSKSLNLGGGACEWRPPEQNIPVELDFQKTFVAGYPSGDKRMAYVQMEALAGFGAKDEWDFAYMGYSNHPFIKGNYPHHEGIWGWGDAADQTVLMVPNVRRSMLEYHDIIWDLGYAKFWEDADALRDNLFLERPDVEDYYEWRDERVMEEIHWYGWHIDYWMEGGLLRDVFTHKLITYDRWDAFLSHFSHIRENIGEYRDFLNFTEAESPEYDPHCAQMEITNGCEPVAIISADKLRDYALGPAENSLIAEILMSDVRTGQYVIAQEAWDCIWEELIKHGKGPLMMYDRPGYENLYHGYNFSVEMLLEMINELNRLIAKYGGPDWNSRPTANRLVEILEEHRGMIETELDEMIMGIRNLSDEEFLGPRERRRRRQQKRRRLKRPRETAADRSKRRERMKIFATLEKKLHDDKRSEMEQLRILREGQAKSGKAVSDLDLVQALSSALTQMRTLQVTGVIDEETALRLVKRIRKVAMEARVGL